MTMIFYRIGAYSLLVTCCLHLIGHFKDIPPANETEKQLLHLMETYVIHVGSGSFTMMSIQHGLSLCFALFFLWTGILSIFLGRKFATQPGILFTVSLINTIMLLMGTAIAFVYFFLPPILSFSVALVSFAAATIAFGRKKK